ncbi:MAG: ATP-binding cassette domain-containing protein [Ignavibacterium sp.]|nr:MAG: ATP-binding cassette domain-containing protein [Ignavibacterium sp.]
MKKVIIQLRDVFYSTSQENLRFGANDSADILFDISLKIYKKEILGICGESGGGKTTLIKLLAGIIKPVNGDMKVDHNIAAKNNSPSKIQILFQNNADLLNPYRKVKTVITEAVKLSKAKKESVEKEKEKLFHMLGIQSDLENRRGNQLSGGERQKVALARLLAVKPRVLILDEPFSAQDVISQLNFLKVLKRINEELELTIICISHDLNMLKKLAHRVIVLQNGRIVESADTSKIFNSPDHPYTKFLLRAEDYSLTEDEIQSYNSEDNPQKPDQSKG